MRIANLNMTEGGSCPDGFRMYSEGGVCACGHPATSSILKCVVKLLDIR